MSKEMIIITVLAVCCAVLLICCIALGMKLKAKNKTKAGNVYVKDGVRYTKDKVETTETGDVKITHDRGDIILKYGVTYTVEKYGKIAPGKYTVLSAQEGTQKFNLRLGGFVREYAHASDLVLKEGEQICAVSHSVILR